MKVAIRENDVFLERDWHEWCTAEILSGNPYLYQIVDLPEDVSDIDALDFECFEKIGEKYELKKEIYEAKKKKKSKLSKEAEILRYRRGTECFPYVDRGEFWYAKLTNEQKEELQEWYQAWLDVTDTKEIPEKPTWLN
jgi:hypothetical protein|nr:MAG TPA: hypothetical protein [Caudoviricetes sp.]